MLNYNIRLISDKDYFDFMKEIPDNSIDCVVTDPPYRCISGGNSLGKDDEKDIRPKGILKENNGKLFKHNNITPKDYLPEMNRVMKDGSHLYLMTNLKSIKEGIISDILESGLEIHNLLVWKKDNAVVNRWYMKNVEYTILARKGEAKPINNKGSKTAESFPDHPLDWPNIKGAKTHPTEKPVSLMETYILNSTKEGEWVMDPFMGTGSTGVASIKNHRKFIGCEIDQEYFDIAMKRLNNETYKAKL